MTNVDYLKYVYIGISHKPCSTLISEKGRTYTMFICLILALLLVFRISNGYTVPLTGKWSLEGANFTVKFVLNSTFGTDIYSVLHDGGVIPDPLAGYGDTELRKISYGNWSFYHLFYLDNRDTKRPIFLELDQIDAFCCVYLNKNPLICTDNSFIHYSVPILAYVRPGWNFLLLKFNSTPSEARRAYQRLSPNPPPPKCWPKNFNGECYINAVRTTQASFGWDWGPAFPVQGFWKTPALRFSDIWLGKGVRFYPVLKGTTWRAALSVEILGGNPNSIVCVHAKLGGGLMRSWEKRCIPVEKNKTNVWMELTLNGNSSVMPWWPVGIKNGPKVYALMVQIKKDWGGYSLDSRSFWVGFRQVELIQVSEIQFMINDY